MGRQISGNANLSFSELVWWLHPFRLKCNVHAVRYYIPPPQSMHQFASPIAIFKARQTLVSTCVYLMTIRLSQLLRNRRSCVFFVRVQPAMRVVQPTGADTCANAWQRPSNNLLADTCNDTALFGCASALYADILNHPPLAILSEYVSRNFVASKASARTEWNVLKYSLWWHFN